MSDTKTLSVPPSEAGDRLDRWLAQALGSSRRQVMLWIDEGRVRVNGRRAKKSDAVLAGNEIQVALPPSDRPLPQPELELSPLYVDKSLLAVNKPAQMAMHPLAPAEKGTLANAVLAHFPDVSQASDEERCPGLLHRLDHHTSGVVLWARTPPAFRAIREQFFRRSVDKRYLALVEGQLPVTESDEMQVMDFPIAHHPKNTRKMLIPRHEAEAKKLKARIALSRFRVLASVLDVPGQEEPNSRGDLDSGEVLGSERQGYSLLEVQIVTGLRHQIRVHLAHLGHPVVGDELYGAKALPGLGRHFLHASSIGFQHPVSGEVMSVEAPLPEELREFLAKIGLEDQYQEQS